MTNNLYTTLNRRSVNAPVSQTRTAGVPSSPKAISPTAQAPVARHPGNSSLGDVQGSIARDAMGPAGPDRRWTKNLILMMLMKHEGSTNFLLLSKPDREKLLKILEESQQNKNLNGQIFNLLTDGKLLLENQEGARTLDGLYALATQPLAPDVDRAKMIGDAADQAAHRRN